jgi:hypothetical protein
MPDEPEMIVDKWGVERPICAAERIARKMATMPRVDPATGRPVPWDEQYESVRNVNPQPKEQP